MMIDTPGTAVMISHNSPRFTQSVQCFQALQLPAGSRHEHLASGLDLSKAREYLADTMAGEWLYMVDDDHLYQPDTLMRLLKRLDERPDVDVVSAFVLRRWMPHPTVIGALNPDGTARIVPVTRGSGLMDVELTGIGGGGVIRRTAFERFMRPWFTGGPFTEDWTFCSRLLKAGGRIAVDLDVQVGHISHMTVWPTRDESGEWGVSYVPLRDGDQRMTLDTVAAFIGTQAREVVPA